MGEAVTPIQYDLWLFNRRLTLSAGYYPMWDTWKLSIGDNGGRQANECLDLNLNVWYFHAGLTVWGLGWLSWLTRWIPTRHKRGWWLVVR